MFQFNTFERSRLATALVTLVATTAASLVCLAASVGPAMA